MASRTTVTKERLLKLDAGHLADILVDLAKSDSAIKRRLRLELAGEAGGDLMAAEIGKRLASLKKAHSFIDWPKRKDFVKDLDLQRSMIVDRLGAKRPDLALDLMWRFMGVAEPALNRVDDSHGTVGDVFRAGCVDLGKLAAQAKPEPTTLANRVFEALDDNGYGVFDDLVEVICPALGEVGITQLKTRLGEALAGRSKSTSDYDWEAAAYRRALQEIADQEGDIDGFIDLIPDEAKSRPQAGTEIGRRLLDAGRAEEAFVALENARPRQRSSRQYDDDDLFYMLADGGGFDVEWEDVYLDALDATGHKDQAQQLRWQAFEKRLAAPRLRAYLKKLPDFEDVIAEDRAKAYALEFNNFQVALHFLIEWPDLANAARLVLQRHHEIDGNAYWLLDPAARTLEGKQPLAASLLRRGMIEDTLNGAKSKRYKHAARHLTECRALSGVIEDYGAFVNHNTFVKSLRTAHGRKHGFWSKVADDV